MWDRAGWMIAPKIWNRATRWFGRAGQSNPVHRGEAAGSPYNGCIIRQHFPSARTLGRRGKYHLWGWTVQGLIMWWGHIIHRLVWERIGWGAPLLPNENQTMFKGTIKIFPQHFIYLAEGGQKYHHQFVDIWYTKILNNLSSDKKQFCKSASLEGGQIILHPHWYVNSTADFLSAMKWSLNVMRSASCVGWLAGTLWSLVANFWSG